MPAGATYVPLAKTTLASDTATVTFSNLNNTYTDLIVVANLQVASATYFLRFRFNNDSGANYTTQYLVSESAGNSCEYVSGESSGAIARISTTMASTIVFNVMNYANTSMFKSTVARGGRGADHVAVANGLWTSTAAITSISFAAGGDWPNANLSAGTTFTIYGILAA